MKESHCGSYIQDTSNRVEMPKKQGLSHVQAFVSIIISFSLVAISAVAFNYAGSINLKFGADGIQFLVDGGSKSSKQED